MKTKAILVAGGKGSRLYPFTRYTQKTLLPLYNRPVIDYALGTIRRSGITNITIISNEHIGQIAKHVGQSMDGEQIHYVLEEEPKGVAEALNLARSHNQDCRILIYFSDNITTIELGDIISEFSAASAPPGCVLLAREEESPQAFGVAVLDEDGALIDVVEKPENPPSNLAIGGIYLFDETFWNKLDDAVNEHGTGFSISDINRAYISEKKARIVSVGEETWVDCGTPETLLQASIMAKDGKLNPNPYRER
ncbi:MAG: sugar nucleotidyltransferase [Euryarchaeota archaeon]|mgnify:FL=1|jgi:glucose-1-phosphate thymidylyltransferase|nr:sugar nucleotidyltransferase [Euryarchaeota archaeon]MBT5592918.1 sugar nucleotidyltransferase [Euryarchaeota archaeon]